MDWNAIGSIVALLLSLMMFSYLLGENVIFRVAEHILVGVSIGWAALQVLYGIIVPSFSRMRDSAANSNLGEFFALLIPLVLGLLMLTRPLRGTRLLTNPVLGVLIGTIAALALGGALVGTLLPQFAAAISPLSEGDIIGRAVLLVATLITLWYFYYATKPGSGSLQTVGASGNNIGMQVRQVGRWFIMLAFGAIFASVFLSFFAALLDRLSFIITLRG